MLLSSMLFSCQTDNQRESINDGGSSDEATTTSYDEPLTEEELKDQLRDTECSDRSKYIQGVLNFEPIYKNIISMKVIGMKLTFELSNIATLATFKDIEVNVSFLSKTGATVLEKKMTLYEFIGPGESIKEKQEIECTNQEYNDITDVSWTVIDASCN